MANWFSQQQPGGSPIDAGNFTFRQRPPSDVLAAAGRGGYQGPGQPPMTPTLHGPWEGGPVPGGGFDRAAYDERYRRGLIPGSPGYEASRQQNPGIDPQTGRPWEATDRGGWGQRTAPPSQPPATGGPRSLTLSELIAQRSGGYGQAGPSVVGTGTGDAGARGAAYYGGQPGGAYDPAQGHGYTPATAVGTGEGPSGALGPGGYVQLRAPTGQMRSVPAAQAAFFLARGATRG